MPELPQIAPAEGGIVPARPVAPSIESAQAGGEAIQRGADQLMDQATAIGVHVAELRRFTAFNDAKEEWVSRVDDALHGPDGVLVNPALKSNPDLARVAAKTRLDAISQDVLKKYPAGNINGALERNFGILAAGKQRAVFGESTSNFEQSAKDEVIARGPQAVMNALHTSDPADAQMIVTNHQQMIDNFVKGGAFTPGQGELLHAKFAHDLAIGQLNQQAVKDPGSVLGLNAAPAGVLPQELLTVQNRARESILGGYKNAETAAEASRADNEATYHALVARGDPGASAFLETTQAHNGFRPGLYEEAVGHPFRPIMPSAPGVYESFQDELKHARNQDDVDRLMESANEAVRPGATGMAALGAKDFSSLARDAGMARAEIKRGAKSGEDWAWGEILKANPVTIMNGSDRFGTLMGGLKEEDVKNHFNQQVDSGAKPADIVKNVQEFIDSSRNKKTGAGDSAIADAIARRLKAMPAVTPPPGVPVEGAPAGPVK